MEINDLEPVHPVSPIAAWIGGKSRLADQICDRLAKIPHSAYAEPFIGMGGIFFRRRWKPRAETLNDVNQDLIILFRILQRHFVPFLDMIRWRLSSRAEFERFLSIQPETMTDLERAARFLYLQRLAFGGKVAGKSFGVSPAEASAFDITKLESMLAEIHDRLAGVTIECLPYGRFIERYDHADMLFYLDPPYWGSERDYGAGVFHGSDFERLAKQLAGIEGRFVLSINDVPEIRRIFGKFHLEEVTTRYSVASGDQTVAAELLVSNVMPAPRCSLL